MNLVIELYWKFGAFFIVVSLILHYAVVLPFLQKRGRIGAGSWLFNLRDGKDLKICGKICTQEGKPLFWYNFLSGAHKILFGWLLGWLILMLIIAVYE